MGNIKIADFIPCENKICYKDKWYKILFRIGITGRPIDTGSDLNVVINGDLSEFAPILQDSGEGIIVYYEGKYFHCIYYDVYKYHGVLIQDKTLLRYTRSANPVPRLNIVMKDLVNINREYNIDLLLGKDV